MKEELIGIFVCLMLVGAVLPATGENLEDTFDTYFGIGLSVKSGQPHGESILGCHGIIMCGEGYTITLNGSFTVSSYSITGEYLGESNLTFENIKFTSLLHMHLGIIPEFYGETFTWVYAELEVTNVTNSEQTDSRTEIGLSIGKLIYFSTILYWINYFLKLLS
jgi:hypothetical protein